MKILWVNANFLHPTTKGGQIRTLEMLRRLHRRHEVHYAAFEDRNEPEGPRRAGEYCAKAYPFQLRRVEKDSPSFLLQLASGLVSRQPLAVSRFATAEMKQFVQAALDSRGFDCVVCDFLVSAANFPSLRDVVLFQHNVETLIWRRRVEQAPDPVRKAYLSLQAKRMFEFEKQACCEAGVVVAVSAVDARLITEMFGVTRAVQDVPTGVDLDYFAPQPVEDATIRRHDLVFVGSMDWMPNVDGIEYFVREVLPLIRREQPGCSLTIVGRTPPATIRALEESDSAITVTGTVADVRPYLWNAAISIVPLRIGGGTRLKIYEAMAARVPVVSTTIGAEGLPVRDTEHLFLADSPERFAGACIRLLREEPLRGIMAEAAWNFVNETSSWEQVTARFEEILEKGRIR